MKNKKKIYFVGNAHLDPVWMWRWQEGSAEAKATVRSALDRMKEYPEFRFVCSASVIFEWIEQYDPAMMEEIKQRVAEGRFVIVGGWYVQPDCNLPSGESFARQSLYAQRYFQRTFGRVARIGYCVDSFGHNLMLPQILKKSGMSHYVFMRPNPTEKEMPAELFLWRSPDGSTVTAWRILGEYLANLQDLSDLETKLESAMSASRNDIDSMLFFYGVGNHGGGPTKRNIDAVLEYRKAHPDCQVIFSDLGDFFDHVAAEKPALPIHTDDLQHHASGCYAAVSAIKHANRRAENAMYAAEIYAFMAQRLLGREISVGAFEQAWKNLLFCDFHDILGGCCIKDAYTDASYMLGESMSFAMRTENTALQSISWAIDTSNAEKGHPILVFNPHSFDVEDVVTVNKQVNWISDGDGNPVPIQHVQSQTYSCMGRSDTAFIAKVPAMGYATYYLKEDAEAVAFAADGLAVDEGSLENEYLRVCFDGENGYIRSIWDKANERELLDGFGAVPVVIDEYAHDTWSHGRNYFDKEIGKFGNGSIEIFERGPLRVTLKVVNRYGDSKLTQFFSLRKGSRTLDVWASVDWREQHKMLKLAYPTVFRKGEAYYEIPFGVIARPTNGEEEPGHSYIALREEMGDGLAILNNNKYSFSVRENVMYLTAIRSPLYGDHGRMRKFECEFTDQGRHDFSYALMPLRDESWSDVIRKARVLNLPMTHILENNHKGTLPQTFCGWRCESPNVIVSALKRAEDGCGTVLRAYECDGKDTATVIGGDMLPEELQVTFGAYSVDTYYHSDTGVWKSVLMTEYDVEDAEK